MYIQQMWATLKTYSTRRNEQKGSFKHMSKRALFFLTMSTISVFECFIFTKALEKQNI